MLWNRCEGESANFPCTGDQPEKMEGDVVMSKRRRSTDHRETTTNSGKSPCNVPEASHEGLIRTGFSLEHEATRQDEIVDFLRSNNLPLVDIRKLGESTMRLFCEIYKITEARGEKMNVHIPSLSITCPDVLSSIKQVIEGLIQDVEEVKNKVISRKKITTLEHSGRDVRKGLHDKKRNHIDEHEFTKTVQEVSETIQEQDEKEDPLPEKERNLQHGENLRLQSKNALPSSDIVVGELPCVRTKLMQDKLRLKRKTDELPQLSEDKPLVRRKKIRIMCQHCLDKPRNSVILRCKHSLYCSNCLNAGEEIIRNCTGCGNETSDIFPDTVI